MFGLDYIYHYGLPQLIPGSVTSNFTLIGSNFHEKTFISSVRQWAQKFGTFALGSYHVKNCIPAASTLPTSRAGLFLYCSACTPPFLCCSLLSYSLFLLSFLPLSLFFFMEKAIQILQSCDLPLELSFTYKLI